jgi:hypothetical protein
MNKRQIEKRISLIPDSALNNNIIPDTEFLFLIKKTEKIIMATYILTDFIPKDEPLKKTLKDNSHDTLNNVCDFLDNRNSRMDAVSKIKSSLIKLNTQYTLANISGFISQMNVQVIKDEINNLLRIINGLERELVDEQVPDFKQSYFGVDVRNKRQYANKTKGVLKNTIKDTNPGDVSDKKEAPRNYSFNNNSKDRDSKVVEIIKDKKEVSIKDISEVILDCSEKTIQRTLNKLISQGKVQKIGERRWAKYSIK